MSYISRLKSVSRREFFKRNSILAASTTAAPWALGLAGMGEAAAQAANDYKALVCVFLGGGNDHAQTIIPYDTGSYNSYASIRKALAIGRADLAATKLGAALPDGREFALAPQMTGLHSLFDQGRAAVLANVGTLMAPTSLLQYQQKTVPLPPKLFSHNDQQSFWQTGGAEGTPTGWGGKLGDLFLGQNGSRSMFTCMSASGNTAFLSGSIARQFQVNPSTGATLVNVMTSGAYGNKEVGAALARIWADEVRLAGATSMGGEWAEVARSACANSPVLNAALATVAAPSGFPVGHFGDQLKMVARVINARGKLGLRRQVFFVNLTGFDLHDDLAARQPLLLAQLSAGLAAFDNAMKAQGLGDAVTTFTASDFGRTLSGNGDGTDHGWGSHHFVVGGAVAGRKFHGTMPSFSVQSSEQVGFGRYIPTTAVDQMAASLARWFGVSEANLPVVLPNLARFDGRAIALFNAGV